jgi:polyribonucleotide nucleotidyltransferase
MKILELEFHGSKISIETGRIARLAGGSVMVRSGGSMVLVTACVGADKGGDFLPLTIDYVEKTYAAGKIPGGFFKREGKLSERETLVSRLMDRPCRPLFPKGFSREVQVIATVVSADSTNDTDILATLGASAALTLSEAPFEGPIASVRVGRKEGKLVINPPISDYDSLDLNYIVAGSKDAIMMVEGGSLEVAEAEILDAIFYAHQELQPLIKLQEELQEFCGKPKLASKPNETTSPSKIFAEKFLKERIRNVVQVAEKTDRRDAQNSLYRELVEACVANSSSESKEELDHIARSAFEEAVSSEVRRRIFEESKRIDGRDLITVRPISIDLDLLPQAHGSSLFTRGETQALVVVTLGTEQEAQRLDSLIGESTKSFMLHYNFPPFSVGETRPMRGPGRREIGHGALAERAIVSVIPELKKFPYVVRIVSEITESNGSSSMATVCGSSLALMQAGVPIKSAVAGVAMGLIKEENRFAVLTDILGDEDHLGDMDFKVCGTTNGITALQMDIKVKGLNREIMSKALEQAKAGRLHILSKMSEVISIPNLSLSDNAPRITSMKVNPDKIRDIIGPGGKMIRSITESCGVKIDISDDGTVTIASSSDKAVKSAIAIIEGLTQEVIIGKLYEGVVKKIMDFGAFVEVIPGVDGLVHISQLADRKVDFVSDVVQEGDIIWVKVLDVDKQGKIRLSLKEALAEQERAKL